MEINGDWLEWDRKIQWFRKGEMDDICILSP